MTAGAGGYAGRERYDEEGARRYAARSTARHAEEWTLVERALRDVAFPATVLDAPCGAGRIAREFLARGASVRGVDLSPAMRAQAETALAGTPGWLGAHALDLEAPEPPREWAADVVVCFRFLHHLPDAATRGRVLRALASLARERVLLSFHHPVSVHHLARALRRVVTGRRGDRHAITVRRLRREAAEAGLALEAVFGLAPYRRDLWVARLRRLPDGRPPEGRPPEGRLSA